MNNLSKSQISARNDSRKSEWVFAQGIAETSGLCAWLTFLIEALFAFRTKMHLIWSPVSSSKHRCNCIQTALRLSCDLIAQTAFRGGQWCMWLQIQCNVKKGSGVHPHLCTTCIQHNEMFVCGKAHGQGFEVASWGGKYQTARLFSVSEQHKCFSVWQRLQFTTNKI